MTAMSHGERIRAALAGDAVDITPVAFWRHWPGDDQSEDSLVAATLHFQHCYDLDLIKVPVSSTYCVADWGVKHAYRGSLMGDRDYLEPLVNRVEDWQRIELLDVQRGVYGWHLRAIERIVRERHSDVPVIVTMFNPLAMACYLSGEAACLAQLRRHPEVLEPVLAVLARTAADFARAAIAAGADGIFLSSRGSSYDLMSPAEYDRFGRPGDLAVLNAAKDGWFNVLHLHGQEPMFAELADYPVAAVNWHDRTAWPSITEGMSISNHTIMAGVEQTHVLRFGQPAEIAAQVRDTVAQAKRRRLIVTPGCTFALDVPQANLMAMLAAARSGR